MAKAAKSDKSKITVSFRVDPDLHARAEKRLIEEMAKAGKIISFSAKMEDLIRAWVESKKS